MVLVQAEERTSMEDDDDEIVQSYKFASGVDIPTLLEAVSIESLGVDDHRTVIIYRSAIFICTVTEGTVDAAHSVDIKLWEPPRKNIDREPPELLRDLVTELLQSADSSLHN